MVQAVVVAVMSLMMILAALVVVLERMERPANVVLDQRNVGATGRCRRWIDDGAVRIQEPLSDIDGNRGVPGCSIDDEGWIEVHLQLGADRRREDERCALERTRHPNALTHQIRIRRVEGCEAVCSWLQPRFQLTERSFRQRNVDEGV